MKRTYSFLLLSMACLAWCCTKNTNDDPIIPVPDPGKNVAGYVAGTYQVSTVLSGSAGSSSLVAGTINGSGTITVTRVNDSTAVYRNQTELTVVATGKKIPLNQEVKNCTVNYYSGIVGLGQPTGTSILSVGQLTSEKRLVVSRYKLEGYDVTIEYKR